MNLNRIALVSLASLFALSACSGAGMSPSTAPAASDRADSAFSVQPYSIPVVTDPKVNAAQTGGTHSSAAENASRSVKYVGQVPGIVGNIFGLLDFIDAPKFGSNDQINLAIIGVDAMSGGTAYPMVSYSSDVIVNALSFKSSALELGGASIPAIPYDGLRFRIDPSQTTVVVNGTTYRAVFGSYVHSHGTTFVPSGSATEADVVFAMPFNSNNSNSGDSGTIQLLIDFDAFDSVDIVNNVAQISPKLHGAIFIASGVIDGTIINKAKAPVSGATVQALNPDGSVAATSSTANDGTFELHGIAGGNYSIVVLNTFTDASGTTLNAQGADSVNLSPIGLSLPAGFKLNLGNIRD
jgi:hypothetical protein